MANMSYCRFRNAVDDVQDCIDWMDEPPKSEEETRARLRFIRQCIEVAESYRYEVERLRGALGPFANYACPEPCDCHNCKARAALKGGA